MNQEISKKYKEDNTRWFKKMAPVYDMAEFFIAPIRAYVARENLPKRSKVLDMACGTGAQSVVFAKKGFSVVGIDLSPDMLARAKKKNEKEYDMTFIYGDASKTNYPDSHFDLCSISFGLHDMPEEVGLAVLKEMRRVTKRDGKIVIVDYHVPRNALSAFVGNKIAKIWESKYYDHFWSVGLEHYLEKTGLKIAEKKTFFCGNIQIITIVNKK